MRKWGIVISAFYALILLGLLLPTFILLAQDRFYGWPQVFKDMVESYGAWELWVTFAILFSGEVLLLFLSVDTNQKRLKPRTHILVSCAWGAMLTGLISCAVIWSLGVAFGGDKFRISFSGSQLDMLGWLGALWFLWGNAVLPLPPQFFRGRESYYFMAAERERFGVAGCRALPCNCAAAP